MIYVTSDIHGNARRFDSILEQINLQPEDTLYILGDVIDRYPDGIRILRKIMFMPNVKMLLGNHEYMLLRAIGHPYGQECPLDDLSTAATVRLWYRNGGDVTHSYWKRIRKAWREEIIQYLHSLPLHYDIEVNGIQYKLVHGAPTEEYINFTSDYDNPIQFAVWKRWRNYEDHQGDYTLIFGHSPTIKYQNDCPMRIWKQPKRIGIDCGSGYPDYPIYDAAYGRLACLRLDDMKEFYSEENKN